MPARYAEWAMGNPAGGHGYEGLLGADFVVEARERRDLQSLEAIWRLHSTEAVLAVAEPMASLRLSSASDLLLDEVVDPQLDSAVSNQLGVAIEAHWPPLSKAGVQRLAAALTEAQAQEDVRDPMRDTLEVWLLHQEGSEIDSFARDALTKELGAQVGDQCLRAAMERCWNEATLAREVGARFEAMLSEDPDGEVWRDAADFAEAMCTDRPPPAWLAPLVDRLIQTAPQLGGVEEFAPDLRRAAVGLSADVINKLLAGDSLPSTPGSRAIARAAGALGHARERSRTFIDVLKHQSALWREISPAATAAWDSTEWARCLTAVQKAREALDEDLVLSLVDAAPVEHVALILPLAVRLAGQPEPEDSFVRAAALKLAGFLTLGEGIDDDERGGQQDVPWWPAKESPERLQVFRAILEQAILDTNDRLPHVVAALEERKVTVAEVSNLVGSEEFESTLSRLEAGNLRRDLAVQFIGFDSDSGVSAVREIQSEQGFQVDLAEASAPNDQDAAFLGAAQAFASLPETSRERLMLLMEQYGRAEEVATLDVIVQDTRAANAKYRRRAALRIGQVTPEGGALPDSVVELLTSNRPELVDAGASVIGRVRPEDPRLIRLLRSVAIESDEGSVARTALEQLGQAFVGQLPPDLPKKRRVDVLHLLAAAGTAGAIAPLLAHVGREALDDDPEVRRLAAAGLKEVAELQPMPPDTLAQLVAVVDEERDQTAREDLQAAVTRATLGEDAALEVLHELIGFSPRHDFRDLLGPEKERVVRHLQLLQTEHERGEQGRPTVILQLDIIAERILRIAYLRYGRSGSLKNEIQNSPKTPDYGELLQALASVSKLANTQGQLRTLHALRSEKTEFAHIGDAPTAEDEATAWNCFKESCRVMVGAIDEE
jgi:hypothetical protein